MNLYRVTFTRNGSGIQSEAILALDEQQARNIFADCEVLRVELVEKDYDQALESQKNAARIWTHNMHVTEDDADAVHNYIVAAEAGDRAALAYGDADLGRHTIISGGEVMELDAHLEARYDEANGGDDLPF